ncbi:hypothetical protein A2125_02515 [Candidatus Woesebacteria bacterium GWB1_43_5]|uniref:Uncharacterized protein n=1 Tax=Candidatus Woesebacteria bacterium GWB1_43_5 TaxID=1802474 RepID=A0A1F7WU71_9BACT|nr:MAG: hypothetical protein A2125_02515 [Candidatus Woesebacteria bacterium GWB1_43_5]
MVAIAEQEKFPSKGLGVEQIPDSPVVPQHLEKGGVSPRLTTFIAQVNDKSGKPLIQTPQSPVVVTLPTDEEKLTSLSKGSIAEAITWLARFWLRMIKKAAYFGWRVVVKPKN